jgi:H+-translocating NAD(P) transhydrogenase subunit alpha
MNLSQLLLLAEETAAQSAGSGGAGSQLMLLLTIFLLAVFVGFEVITKIPPTLHTPLMSGSNAISGITLVGLATMNVVGGFLVTHRMLGMFRKKKG